MQMTFLQFAQGNATRFYERVGRHGAWLGAGSMVCVMLAIIFGLNGQDAIVPLGALMNCSLVLLGIYVSSNILAAIKSLLSRNGEQVICVPAVRHCFIPFATIPPTSLPFDGLVRTYRLPPPLAPTISS